MCIAQFLYPLFASGHLDYFSILGIMNTVAMNTEVPISLQDPDCSSFG